MADKLALLGGPKAVTVPWPDQGTIGPDEIAAATRVVASGHISDCGRGETVAAMEGFWYLHDDSSRGIFV